MFTVVTKDRELNESKTGMWGNLMMNFQVDSTSLLR